VVRSEDETRSDPSVREGLCVPLGPMGILVTRKLGYLSGHYGRVRARIAGCLWYVTKLVGGVSRARGDEDAMGCRCSTRWSGREGDGGDATMIFVPPGLAGDAILSGGGGSRSDLRHYRRRARQDMIRVRAVLDEINAADQLRCHRRSAPTRTGVKPERIAAVLERQTRAHGGDWNDNGVGRASADDETSCGKSITNSA